MDEIQPIPYPDVSPELINCGSGTERCKFDDGTEDSGACAHHIKLWIEACSGERKRC